MKEDLLLYVTEDNKMTIRLLPNHQYVTDNLIDLEQEELFIFEKDQILVKKKETLDLRIIPVIMNTLIDDLAGIDQVIVEDKIPPESVEVSVQDSVSAR